MGKFIDLTGFRFNHFTVLHFDKSVKCNYTWICKCDCGTIKSVRSSALKKGTIKSCGCFKKSKQHGHSRCEGDSYDVYRAWQSMKARCHQKTNKDYYLYGERGISVYDEWRNNFKSFYDYIGDKPSKKHSLDRFPNKNGNYEPGNIRWATGLQQGQNVRRNVEITFNGITMVLAEWGRYFGVTGKSIRLHLNNGRTIEQIAAHYKYKKDNNITTWIPFQLFD